MFHPIELFIGLRYTRAKRRNHFISFISMISMLGIAIGVLALIVVISVMNGFEQELRVRILGMASHATVSSVGGPLQNWQSLSKTIQSATQTEGVAPYVEAESMLTYRSSVSGTLVRGIEPEWETQVSNIADKMVAGNITALAAGQYGIILGSELALSLNASLGDRVTLVTPTSNVTAIGVLPRLKRFTVVGLFEVGMYEYDRSMAYIHLQDASKLYRLDGGVTGIRIKLDDMFSAPAIAAELKATLGYDYWVSDWTRRHANFFRAVKTERTVMFVILALIVAVAAFNIVSTLVMVVTDKQADIAILKTLGLGPSSILGIFVIQGTLIGLVGTLIGMLSGVLIALNVETIVPAIEALFQVKFLAPDVYYISDLPSEMRWSDVLRISGLSFFLTVIATLYPAWRAAQTQPAEALRYE
ncbi:MAG: lipoprotein-releasing ABC transporter permease subunit [Gammaproteobacteria bacterium]|nr:lipoprotein-releasing ABC transporter permease subunit [Gammaproteobacteria bacterium]